MVLQILCFDHTPINCLYDANKITDAFLVVNDQFTFKEYTRLIDPTPFKALGDWSSRNLQKEEMKEFLKELLH